MKIISWNCKRATATRSLLWDYLLNEQPDIALLQEVSAVPEEISRNYTVIQQRATGKITDQRFSNVILSKHPILDKIELTHPDKTIQHVLNIHDSNALTYEIDVDGDPTVFTCVYAPPWPIEGSLEDAEQFSEWFTEILPAAIAERTKKSRSNWIIAGDFNSSITFDSLPGFIGRNEDNFKKIEAAGFTELLKHHQGVLTPTFKNPRGGKVIHQIDHMFVSNDLVSRLTECATGSVEDIFGQNLSDHLPIIATFKKH